MTRPAARSLPSSRAVARASARVALVGLVLAALTAYAVVGRTPGPAAATSGNVATPGSFTGYGFDQCLAPDQATMDRWLRHSPFLAVGIYISGNSRACRSQPNLTPTWVSTQLRKGWRLLPITLGPQSTCVGRYPKYGASVDPTISNNSTDGYAAARRQGVTEGGRSVTAAGALGIVPGSTLWYDLEGWSDHRNATCRESALKFVTGWVREVRRKGYVAGVYSSAGSGMKILDDARVQGRTDVTLPDRIWIARWDGVANTSTSYIRPDGWLPGNRMKQYQGGHDETWGGVTINIDRNWLDLGAPQVAPAETHCGGIRVDHPSYARVAPPTSSYRPPAAMVRTVKCLMSEKGFYDGRMGPYYRPAIRDAVARWHAGRGLPAHEVVDRADWTRMLAEGAAAPTKRGSVGPAVRRVQRALNAATGAGLRVTGVFDASTQQAVTGYQRRVGIAAVGFVDPRTWRALRAGRV